MALHRKLSNAQIAQRRERRQKRRRYSRKRRRSGPIQKPDWLSQRPEPVLSFTGLVGSGRGGGGLAMDPQYSWGRKRQRRARQQAAEAAKGA